MLCMCEQSVRIVGYHADSSVLCLPFELVSYYILKDSIVDCVTHIAKTMMPDTESQLSEIEKIVTKWKRKRARISNSP